MVKKKIKIAVLISLISVIVAMISLSFSVYMGIRESEYKNKLEEFQMANIAIQEKSAEFSEAYKKIELAEKNIIESSQTCAEINSLALEKSLEYLKNARSAVINNDYALSQFYLNEINRDICKSKLNNSIWIEVLILIAVWVALLIALFTLKSRKAKIKR